MGLKSLSELGSGVMEQIYLCAINRYPNEACGFLVRTNGDKYRFIETRNVSDNPQ
ncbi:phage tail protein, partial [Salmonella enterica subsp. enterica serovar Cerro]